MHQWKAYLFSSQVMYKSPLEKKNDPYDRFCGPGSQIGGKNKTLNLVKVFIYQNYLAKKL